MKVEDRRREFASVLCLVYHEARNVRHLLKTERLDSGSFEPLRNLPTNRYGAWAEMQATRWAAAEAADSSLAAQEFTDRFGLTLEDLVVLYENPNWKHAAYGGNAWADITRAILALRDELGRDEASASESLGRISTMRHNTGVVALKLGDLDASLPESTTPRSDLP